jgi:bacterioferritin-associated ferredoxin
MSVNRCICHNISFEKIREIAVKHEIDSLDELRAMDICSTRCKLCEPYLKQMLRTGETSFEPGLIFETDNRL